MKWDWVDVANDLLSKCHLNLRLRKITDCDANIFIALYENILGEKVPDYIAVPSSQEDDIHNVQAVIDSLSLDYLQISLSHITGENVVRGNRESIKNLLEIFDGLLEYLKEEMNEESQNDEELNDSLIQKFPDETKGPINSISTEHKGSIEDGVSSSSSGKSSVHSSKQSLHSWSMEEVASASELIGLGVSARTFTAKQQGPVVPPLTSEAVTASGPQDVERPSELLQTAIALQPPAQSNNRPDTDSRSPSRATADGFDQRPPVEEAAPATAEEPDETPRPPADTLLTNGVQSPAVSERSSSSRQRARREVEREALEPTNGGPKRVLFSTQPDVLFLTLRDETAAKSPSPPDTEEEEQDEEDLRYMQRQPGRRMAHRDGTRITRWLEEERLEEPLLYRRQRNKQAEEELHSISEKLSNRLEELDQMLKRVLNTSGESADVKEDDRQSDHSDGSNEHPGTSQQHAVSETSGHESAQQAHSSPPSPPLDGCSLQGRLEEAMAAASSLDDVSDHSRREEPQHRPSHRKQKYLQSKAYEEELKRYEEREQEDLDTARLEAQEAERRYREAILKDVCQTHRPSPARTKPQRKSGRNARSTPGQRWQEAPRRAPSLKVKENELLPVLLEELPHLHISPRALGRMWDQQMHQLDRIHAASSSGSQHRKLSREVEEAQKKHDLLSGIIQKDQAHHRRLRDFKERTQQQKSTQNRLREQRQQIARAKRYHNEYHTQHRAQLMKARTKEERMFRQLYEEGLEIQKARLREQRAYAKEQRLEHQKRHQDQIKSMENYYKDQFSLLAERLAQERQDLQVRKRAQEKTLLKMKQELRSRMEREIGEMQKIIVQNNEDDFFQDLEVQRMRNRIKTASFQYNTSSLP
ncbi:centrosomal protein of 95 kDa-like isoform X2 [Antennarius striatus]|uniref:centrosomal protein of 95 kDa-like isoform X2 n=1 Tax=Antennarius striatus TaxID=241820 RepID=UPI0035AEB2DF